MEVLYQLSYNGTLSSKLQRCTIQKPFYKYLSDNSPAGEIIKKLCKVLTHILAVINGNCLSNEALAKLEATTARFRQNFSVAQFKNLFINIYPTIRLLAK